MRAQAMVEVADALSDEARACLTGRLSVLSFSAGEHGVAIRFH